MRLWTLHPCYLDAKGLVAVWREALLAQKVLQGKTKAYRHHPQLIRFQKHSRPAAVLAAYLTAILKEAKVRGYHFDGRKISRSRFYGTLVETDGQLLYEWDHLKQKLRKRDHQKYLLLKSTEIPKPHPLFRIISGPCQDWERVK
ncbi:MAG: pyrimidine dimer DNA glycosylase/endonuclease V [Ignavibacteriales bacterium]|nr:pyrimidine dimer DNA glycosylase/endonuclease V [Ignavibacteriales bacterium]